MFQIDSMQLLTGERYEGLVLTWLPDGILIELPQQKASQLTANSQWPYINTLVSVSVSLARCSGPLDSLDDWLPIHV